MLLRLMKRVANCIIHLQEQLLVYPVEEDTGTLQKSLLETASMTSGYEDEIGLAMLAALVPLSRSRIEGAVANRRCCIVIH
jgi:hypothetical protein